MARKTPDYQIKAVKKYQDKFKFFKIAALPEEHDAIVAHAKAMGDRSTTAFILRAIRETMEREKKE